MTWQVKSKKTYKNAKWLVRFIVPAFFLFSACSQKDSIDAPQFGVGDNIKAYQIDTFEISTSTIFRDSINTSSASNLLVGKIESQEFGRVSCNSFFQTSLSGNTFITTADPVFDSMILVLRPNYLHGNPDAIIKMGVYRLKEGFDRERTYIASESLEYDKKPLAEVSFTATEIQNKNLRINLSELGNQFLNDRNLNFFQSSIDFVEYFKGIALITENAEGSVVGFQVDLASSTSDTSTSGIFFYYKTSKIEEEADTTFYKFPISVNYSRFNQIIHDKPAILSPLKSQNQKLSSDLTNDELFLMAGTGIISRLEFPTYQQLRNQHRNLIVEQATLTIDARNDEIPYYLPPEELFMFKVDSNESITLYNGGDVGSGTSFNNIFSIDVTNYFSDLVYNRESITQFVLIPSKNGSTINQLKYGAFSRTESPIKLLVYYIPIN